MNKEEKQTGILFVKTLTNNQYTINFCNTDTIDDVKNKITEASGIPIDQMKLLYLGKRLYDGLTINDYLIKEGSIINMIHRLRGNGL